MKTPRWASGAWGIAAIVASVAFVLSAPSVVFAQDEAAPETAAAAPAEESAAAEPGPLEQMSYAFDNFVMFLTGVLVIFMQAGFALLEAGLNHRKNTVNILMKNLLDFSFGVLLFFVIGYSIMYNGGGDSLILKSTVKAADSEEEKTYGYFGFKRDEQGNPVFGIGSYAGTVGESLNSQVDWLFQAAFAATAATIVSGAVAGRLKFSAYIIYSMIITGLIYPVSGFWKWGGGFLNEMGFYDFAGSVVVHAVGGFAGLAGAIMLGPRLGKFGPDGKPRAMPGHSMPLAALGAFILWIGWYGFNPGSQLVYSTAGDINAFVVIAANTTLAAAAGCCASMVLYWIMFGKPDLTMAINGALAGLVGITANCDSVTNLAAIIIGGIAGLLVVLAVLALDRLKIDDPVGAFPVHGVCGVWGGLATGIKFFHLPKEICEQMGRDPVEHVFTTQLYGTAIICVWAFVAALILFGTLKLVGLLRVSAEEEEKGLDLGEHGMEAYVM